MVGEACGVDAVRRPLKDRPRKGSLVVAHEGPCSVIWGSLVKCCSSISAGDFEARKAWQKAWAWDRRSVARACKSEEPFMLVLVIITERSIVIAGLAKSTLLLLLFKTAKVSQGPRLLKT